MTIRDVADKLNSLSPSYRVGRLREIRKVLTGRRPASKVLFDPRNVSEKHEYAFHRGGRKELQFNVGFEPVRGERLFRHGVAFSFEKSERVFFPELKESLSPRVRRFNEYVLEAGDSLADMRMWHWKDKQRWDEYTVSPIPDELIAPGVFIALGKLQESAGGIDYELVLEDLDRLLLLYEYVEGSPTISTVPDEEAGGLAFGKSALGKKEKKSHTTVVRVGGESEMMLRHNDLQTALCKHLIGEYGKEAVDDEVVCGPRKRVDVVRQRKNGTFVLYEIKTSACLQSCIREAVAQLLEYTYWRPEEGVKKLVIVTENDRTDEAAAYLVRLRDWHGIPIYHQKFDRVERKLEVPW